MHTPRLIVLLAGGIFLVICGSLIRSIILSRQAHQALEDQRQHVEALQQEVHILEEKVEQATSSFELERRVREDLSQQKTGEKIIELRDH